MKAAPSFRPSLDKICRMTFMPDGKSLAIACEDGSLSLWDLTTKKSRVKFEGDASQVRSLVFSPDGKMLAGGGWECSLYIWEVATGKLIMSKWWSVVTGRPVHGVAFSPDGKTLASSGMVRDPDGKAKHSFYETWDHHSLGHRYRQREANIHRVSLSSRLLWHLRRTGKP